MKTLLLIPKDVYREWPIANDVTRYTLRIPAMTFPQLAACLEDSTAQIFDGIVTPISIKDYMELIKRFDVVCLNVVCASVALNVEANLAAIKKTNPNIKTILGGHHATFYHEEWVERGADYVVRGEGEETLRELIEKIGIGKSLSGVRGITYRADGKTVVEEERPLINNLDDLPFPRFDLLDLRPYRLYHRNGLTASVETSRGCPHPCTFCCVNVMWRNRQRFKSVARVMEELKRLVHAGVTQIAIVDDNFGGNMERDMKIFESILGENMKLDMWMFCRVDTAFHNPCYIELAAKAGVRQVYVGFESTSPLVLNKYKKGSSDEPEGEMFREAYKTFKKNDIFVLGTFITGFLDPEEEKAGLKNCASVCDDPCALQFRLIKGTRGYAEVSDKAKILLDTFYQNRFLPVFKKEGEQQKRINYIISHMRTVFSAKNIFKTFFGAPVEKRYFRDKYSGLISNLLSFNLKKLVDFLIVIDPRRPPNERLRHLVDRYTRNTRSQQGG